MKNKIKGAEKMERIRDRKFMIRVGEVVEHYDFRQSKNVVGFDGNVESLRLRANTIAQAKEILKIAGVTIYQIFDTTIHEGFDGKLVFESPEITEWKEKKEEERKRVKKRQEEKVIKINALPEIFPIKVEGGYWVKRAEATFRSGYSHRIQWGLTIEKQKGNFSEMVGLYNYVTRDGKLLKKRITEELGINEKDAREILRTQREVRKQIEEIINK